MWLYSGSEDTARVHPEEVPSKTVAMWLKSITGNQDNPEDLGESSPTETTIRTTRYALLFRPLGVYVLTALDVD